MYQLKHLGNNKVKLVYGGIAVASAFMFSVGIPAVTQQAYAAACVQPTSATVLADQAKVGTTYTAWKAAHVTSAGAGGNLRVQRSAGDNFDTVSEGIGYGMIFAAYNNDKTTFDGLWAYEQAHVDELGLMHWKIDAAGNIAGQNSATDADEDMAIALVAADKRWGGYETQAKQQLDLLLAYTVEAGSNILKPGDHWGGSDVLNPSYISPAYYKVFADYSGNSHWNDVADANNAVLSAIAANSNSKTTGLVPNWSNSLGQPAYNMSYDYSYDSIRNPIRLALDSQWYCDTGSTDRLNTFNTFFESKDATNIVDGYKLNGVSIGKNYNSSFVGPVAAASVVSKDTNYRDAIWQKLNGLNDKEYYNDSIKLLSMMVASGQFTSPLSFNAPKVAVPDVPLISAVPISKVGDIDVWWPKNGVTVSGTLPLKATLPSSTVAKYEMYWQVDNGAPNLMPSNYKDWPHKETSINVDGWKWRGNGPYDVSFTVFNADGEVVSTKTSSIMVRH